MIMGVGIQNYDVKAGLNNVSHNAIQEIFVAWGILGFIAVLLIVIESLYAVIKKHKLDNVYYYLPLITLLLMIQAGQFFSTGLKILNYAIVLLPLGLTCNNSLNDKEE